MHKQILSFGLRYDFEFLILSFCDKGSVRLILVCYILENTTREGGVASGDGGMR